MVLAADPVIGHPLNASSTPDGSRFTLLYRDEQESVLGVLSGEDVGTTFQVTADFSSLGAQDSTVSLFAGNRKLAEMAQFTGSALFPIGLGEILIGLVQPDGSFRLELSWSAPLSIEVDGLGNFVADRIQWVGKGITPLPLRSVDSFDLQGSMLPALTVDDIETEQIFVDGFESGDSSSWSSSVP